MTTMLKIALFCILGALQVSSQYPKCVEQGVTVVDIKCGEGILGLLEKIEKAVGDMKALQEAKITSITVAETAERILYKCGCGKECEEKKCQEEVIEAMKSVKEDKMRYLEPGHADKYLETLLNAANDLSQISNEMHCCCKNSACVQKVDLPEPKTRETKECKEGKCNKEVKQLIEVIDKFLPVIRTSLEDLDIVLKYITESIPKLKEYIPKEGSCKDEKSANPLLEIVDLTAMYLGKLIRLQRELNLEISPALLKSAEEGLKCYGYGKKE